MALGQGLRETNEEIGKRFGLAQDGRASDEQLEVQQILRFKTHELASFLNSSVADGREKSLALTHLEDALMWAGKAIFS